MIVNRQGWVPVILIYGYKFEYYVILLCHLSFDFFQGDMEMGEDGRQEGKGIMIRIKMQYVFRPIPHNECVYYVLPTYTNKRECLNKIPKQNKRNIKPFLVLKLCKTGKIGLTHKLLFTVLCPSTLVEMD